MQIRSHRDLIVWQKGVELVVEVYAIAKRLPASERAGLGSQMRRAAASIPANVAEGAGRMHRGDYLRFVSIARGSQMELDTHLEIAVRLGYVTERQIEVARELSGQVGRMLGKLGKVLAGRATASHES